MSKSDDVWPHSLHGSRWGGVGISLFSLFAVVVMLVREDWIGAVVFACMLPLGMWFIVVPDSLDIADGTLVVKRLGRTRRFAIAECAEFKAQRPRFVVGFGARQVMFDYRVEQARPLQRLNRRLAGASILLPDTYGLTATELADRLNAARASCAREQGA